MFLNKTEFKEHLQKVNEERYKIQGESIAILQEYQNQTQKLFLSLPQKVAIQQFKAINDKLSEKREALCKIINNEQTRRYLEAINKPILDIQNVSTQIIKPFFNSHLHDYICELFKEATLKEAISFYHHFVNESIKLNLSEEQEITLLKRAIEQKQEKQAPIIPIEQNTENKEQTEIEENYIPKGSLYQNPLIIDLLKVIGIFAGYSTSPPPPKDKPSKTQKNKIITWEKEKRLFISYPKNENENFTISIDKNKKITPANFRDFIYLLKELTNNIKSITHTNNIKTLAVEIDLNKASKEKNKRKDRTKDDFEALKDIQSLRIEEGKYFSTARNRKSKEERYIDFKGFIFDDKKPFEINSKTITIYFSSDFIIPLLNSQLMIIPSNLFSLNLKKNPIIFNIAFYLLAYERESQKTKGKIRDYKKPIITRIETLLNNTGRNLEETIKNQNTAREKTLYIQALQELVRRGFLKEYHYKKDGIEYPANKIEKELQDNKYKEEIGFSEWRKYSIAFYFSDEITQKLKDYNKKSPITKFKVKNKKAS